MSITFLANNVKDMSNIAKQILEYASEFKKFIFYADMGVGKTTLIKELSLQLNVVDEVSSPTFSIVNEYHTDNKDKIYHFDFYRIEKEEEAYDIGCDEYLFGNDYCFIEWPENIPNLISNDMVVIKMHIEHKKRIIELII
tara:strand:+ start:1772 stop:2191 length:420 start_codon:yes stop_codon:yes gene_type:complete